eukprot:scaffold993_cov393-Prasinococcus_capsulatus_cf.AAC.5
MPYTSSVERPGGAPQSLLAQDLDSSSSYASSDVSGATLVNFQPTSSNGSARRMRWMMEPSWSVLPRRPTRARSTYVPFVHRFDSCTNTPGSWMQSPILCLLMMAWRLLTPFFCPFSPRETYLRSRLHEAAAWLKDEGGADPMTRPSPKSVSTLWGRMSSCRT